MKHAKPGVYAHTEGSQGGSGTAAAKMKKKMTTPKDPHAPKEPLTAYNIFAADQNIPYNIFVYVCAQICKFARKIMCIAH